MLVFLITALGFVPFAFDPGAPQFRCQVTGLLLLTSVNFRWIVTQRLPSVGYLTSLDKYAIGSLLCLVLFCVWHSLIGSSMIATDADTRKYVDKIVLISAACFYLLYNLFCIVWFVRMHRTIKKFQDESELLAAKSAAVRSANRRKKDEETKAMAAAKQSMLPTTSYQQLATNANQFNFSNNNSNGGGGGGSNYASISPNRPQSAHATMASSQNEQNNSSTNNRASMVRKPPTSPTSHQQLNNNPMSASAATSSGSASNLNAKSSSVKSRTGRQAAEP
jgi:hypothetical protein